MDIYKINFNPTNNAPCTDIESDLITLSVSDVEPNDFKQVLAFELNESIKNKVIDFAWTIGEDTAIAKQNNIEYDFKTNGSYPVQLRVVNWCDTCLVPVVSCKQAMVNFKIHPHDPLPPKDLNIENIAVGTKLSKEQLVQLGFDVTPIYFDLNKSVIREDAQALLNKNIAVLKKYKMLAMNLIGNTDARASENYNNQLSKDRALATKKYLINSGITKQRIENIEGKGKTQLVNDCIDTNCDDNLHQLNRRVEFEIIKR